MKKNTLDILSEAISDIGSWQWWYTAKDMFQLEFSDVMLYDETGAEKDPHTSMIALGFVGNAFAVFLDNLEEETGKKWYDRFYDDEIQYLQIEPYEFRFDDIDYAKTVFAGFKNKTSMKSFENTEVFSSVKHILAAKCEDYGFIAGGDDLVVVGKKGRYTEEEIENAAKRWWAYWRDYWRLRNTKDAYEKDWACEVTIPVDSGHPTGNWYEGQDDRQ